MSYLAVSCEDSTLTPVTITPDSTEVTDTSTVVILDSSSVDVSKIYIPNEFKGLNFYKSSSPWYYGRSRQSEHFIVFWAAGYEDNDPASDEVPAAYRVDIDDLLEKAEEFYRVNIETLKFAEIGEGKSNLDDYKMMIFLFYQDEWLATGSGYDDVIGALWVSPNTCQPVGSTIGHEIGHSFQYQVNCDLGGGTGFRYGFGGNGGNSFWEQTAQWQSFQSYPDQAFTSHNFTVYSENYHRHVIHEWYRYASYFLHYYWADKHGIDIVGKVWREAQQPEDPVQAYMRITGISVEQLNDEIYDAATKLTTWDIPAIRDIGSSYIGAHKFGLNSLDDGGYMVAYGSCPGTTGYNVIPLNVPDAGTVVSTAFEGKVNEPGYNTVKSPFRAGWRYGYVALLDDGTRVYGDMHAENTGSVDFTVPENCDKLWLVVTGAPNTYLPHAWDEEESNDDQWPYQVTFTNTDVFGNVTFDGTEVPSDINLTYEVVFPADAEQYSGSAVDMGGDVVKLAYAFVMQPSEITSAIGSSIKFYAVEADGTLNAQTTANGYGHWYDADGNVIAWGDDALVFSEFNESGFIFSIGQYPGHCSPGDQYTIRQALVLNEDTSPVQATFTFNITIE